MKHVTILFFLILVIISCKSDDNNSIDQNTTQNKPNILLIIADDMGLDATPSYNIGSIQPNMPTLQGMITSGIKFNNLWSNPTCTPTRGSIITGKYGFRTNIYSCFCFRGYLF